MKDARKARIAMLAGASLLAAAGALAPAHASDVDPAAYPAVITAPVDIPHAADHEPSQQAAKRWTLLAIAAGALAGLIRLIGPRKIAAVATKTAVVATKAAAVTVRTVGKAAGKAFAAPLRFLMLFASLVTVAFLGVGVFDAEWTAGLVVGAIITATAYFMAFRLRRALVPALVKPSINDVRVNENLPRKTID
jgi:hypothetical protein